MGGYGSGRWSSKPTAESKRRLDLARLRRDGSLMPGTVFKLSWSSAGEETGSIGVVASAIGLRLMYDARSSDGSSSHIDETVRLTWTQPPFGGRRAWFNCPGCHRLCHVLFGGIRFRCRHCCRIRYRSQAETRTDRANRGMVKLVRRIDPTADLNRLPPKPRGMHWRTYKRLTERYDAYANLWGKEVMRKFGIRL